MLRHISVPRVLCLLALLFAGLPSGARPVNVSNAGGDGLESGPRCDVSQVAKTTRGGVSAATGAVDCSGFVIRPGMAGIGVSGGDLAIGDANNQLDTNSLPGGLDDWAAWFPGIALPNPRAGIPGADPFYYFTPFQGHLATLPASGSATSIGVSAPGQAAAAQGLYSVEGAGSSSGYSARVTLNGGVNGPFLVAVGGTLDASDPALDVLWAALESAPAPDGTTFFFAMLWDIAQSGSREALNWSGYFLFDETATLGAGDTLEFALPTVTLTDANSQAWGPVFSPIDFGLNHVAMFTLADRTTAATAVSAPGTWALSLMALAAAGLGWRRRRTFAR